MTLEISIHPPMPLRIIHNRIASIRPRAHAPDGSATPPNIVPMQDLGSKPNATGKGNYIPIRENVWRFMEMYEANNPGAYKAERSLSVYWINNTDYDQDTDYSTALAECITSPYNVVEIITQSPTHYKIWSWPNDFPFGTLDPNEYNWQNYPTRFFKGIAEGIGGRIDRLGGKDVHFPFLHRTEKVGNFTPQGLWMWKPDLELWPLFPDGLILDGIDVYDHQMRPLLTHPNGVALFHDRARFFIETPSVPPDR